MDKLTPVRCDKCRKVIGEFSHVRGKIKCKCGHVNIIIQNKAGHDHKITVAVNR